MTFDWTTLEFVSHDQRDQSLLFAALLLSTENTFSSVSGCLQDAPPVPVRKTSASGASSDGSTGDASPRTARRGVGVGVGGVTGDASGGSGNEASPRLLRRGAAAKRERTPRADLVLQTNTEGATSSGQTGSGAQTPSSGQHKTPADARTGPVSPGSPTVKRTFPNGVPPPPARRPPNEGQKKLRDRLPVPPKDLNAGISAGAGTSAGTGASAVPSDVRAMPSAPPYEKRNLPNPASGSKPGPMPVPHSRPHDAPPPPLPHHAQHPPPTGPHSRPQNALYPVLPTGDTPTPSPRPSPPLPRHHPSPPPPTGSTGQRVSPPPPPAHHAPQRTGYTPAVSAAPPPRSSPPRPRARASPAEETGTERPYSVYTHQQEEATK